MRVHFLNHSAAPSHLGGSELSLLALIEAWAARDPDFVPTIISPTSRAAVVRVARERGYDTLNLPFEGWALFADPGGRPEAALRAHRDFASTRRIIERLRADKVNLVVTNTIVSPWAAYAAAALGIPHVWFIREFADPSQGFRFPAGRDAILRDVGRLSALVVANSKAVRSALEKYIPPELLATSYPWVDLAAVRSASSGPTLPEPFPLDAAALKIIVVGRLTRTKGQWRVIDALGLLRSRGITVAACFVGATVERDADVLLSRRAARLGVADAVTFIGEQTDPSPFVQAADVGLTVSDHESFGRATLEYMALGKPVIAAHNGGSVELVVEGETGYLVDPDDIEALADRLERLAQDAAGRAEMGRRGAFRAEELMGASHPDALIDRLRDIAGTHPIALPETVVGWLGVPETWAPGTMRALAVAVRVRHGARRARSVLRHPFATIRRVWLRSRRSGSAPATPQPAQPPND